MRIKITAVLLFMSVMATSQNWPSKKIGRFQSVSTNGAWSSTLFNLAAGTGGTLTNGNYTLTYGAGFTGSDTAAALLFADTVGNQMSFRLKLSDMSAGINYIRASDTKNNLLSIYADSILIKMLDVKVGLFDSNGNFTLYKNFYVTGDILSDALRNNRFGTDAGKSLTTGSYNTFIGYQSGVSNTTANENTYFGYKSGYANIVGIDNTGIGSSALLNNVGSYNTAIGREAMKDNTTGEHNGAFGGHALFHNKTGSFNTACGVNALYTADASFNTAVGEDAMRLTTTGTNNVSVGYQSMYKNTTQSYNTVIGEEALWSAITGIGQNVVVGASAMYSATGIENTCVGTTALKNLTAGDYNIALGWRAGYGITSGNSNIYIGRESGNATNTGSGNIFIGDQSGYNETGSNKLYIENSNSATPLIYGDFITDKLTINGDQIITDTTFTNTISPYSGTTTTFPQNVSVAGTTSTNTIAAYSGTDISFSDNVLMKDVSIAGNTIIGNAGSDRLTINSDTIFVWGDTLTGQIEFTDYVGNIGNAITPNDTVFFDCQSDGLFMDCLFSVELDSAENFSFPDTNTVYFTINVYDGDELVEGIVEKDGTVNIYASYGTITWDDADTSGDYCVYDAGTYAILTNNTATTKIFVGRIRYKRP